MRYCYSQGVHGRTEAGGRTALSRSIPLCPGCSGLRQVVRKEGPAGGGMQQRALNMVCQEAGVSYSGTRSHR
ncbi:hypothetical protein DSM19430T_18350 [Desulfovibrio psychrotolerans]|uniref:Uncharacterized protein n=1 Tax=Desulfovibrio psychrotolerans TaxID=415242 RepID=A0A7J0BVF0_9BACT|nr:hypothetical protein DSM19430T_18350 [Desulfovibrio psychrotolerans]